MTVSSFFEKRSLSHTGILGKTQGPWREALGSPLFCDVPRPPAGRRVFGDAYRLADVASGRRRVGRTTRSSRRRTPYFSVTRSSTTSAAEGVPRLDQDDDVLRTFR